MGIALKVPGIDFSGANLGKVHPQVPGSLNSISITGSASVYGTAQYDITYDPADTQLVGVEWSIDSGGTFATIDQNGLVTALSGASGSSVRIKAVSVYDSSVYATKDIVVTYLPDWVKPDAGFAMSDQFTQTGITPAAVDTIKVVVRYKLRALPSGFYFGSRSGTMSGSSDMVCVSFPTSADEGNVMLGATNTGNFLPKTLDTDYILEFDKDGVTLNGEPRAWLGSVGSGIPTRQIYIGGINSANPLTPLGTTAGVVSINSKSIQTEF